MRLDEQKGRVIAVVILVMLVLASAAQGATITVTTSADTVANDGQCSLREALNAAALDTPSGSAAGECSAGVGPDTIMIGPGQYVLTRTGAEDDTNVAGDLDVIGGTVAISGAGPGVTKVDGGGIDRVFDVLAGANLTLRDLTITGGKAPAGSAGASAGPGGPGVGNGAGSDSLGASGAPGGGGGGIRNAGTLSLTDVVVTLNTAGNGGTGGASSDGGTGGSAANLSGGEGGTSNAGEGGSGGAGGGLLSTQGSVSIAGSTFTLNTSGAGGAGGSGGNGGTGGAGQGNGSGGAGGFCFGGGGGEAGDGGAIDAEMGTLTISNTVIDANTADSGGPGGGCVHGGTGGAGAGSGAGGGGGPAFAGSGGEGGFGGGVADNGAALTLTNTTLAGNFAGGGGLPSSQATGGNGGTGGAGTGGGGGGGFVEAGSGGGAGFGGGLSLESGSATLVGDTIANNQTGAGTKGADATSGGTGGADGGGGGGSGVGGNSTGGGGGLGGDGGGAELRAPFALTDVTVTSNTTGAGGAGGAGGSGPGRSTGAFGENGGFGGGLDITDEGALAHVTAVENQLGASGSGGSGGTGTPATPGSPGEAPEGPDLDSFLSTGETVTVSASIAGACNGPLRDGGGNVAVPATTPCPGLQAAPGLGPLADNGGPTQTMALLAGSPAIDLIPAPCGTIPDQRGVARPQGAGCDAGAYEHAPPGVVTGSASLITTSTATIAGRVVPNARATTWHFEFGPTTAYGSATPTHSVGAGLAAVPVSISLTGLAPGAVIHYRLVATDADGTTTGADAILTTLAAPAKPTPHKFAGATIVSVGHTMSAKGRVAVALACPSSTRGSCTGTLLITTTVKSKGKGNRPKTTVVSLAHATFKIAPGHRKTIQLQLGPAARARLRAAGRRGLIVKFTAKARDASGAPATTTRSATLKRALAT